MTNGQTTLDVRFKIAALWAAMLFVFSYVDLFGLFRADIIAGVTAGKVAGFQVDQLFLLLTTAYVIVPSLMIYLSLVLKPAANRWANIVLAAIYALTVIGSCIGETWWYYYLGSAVEVVLLGLIIRHAWTLR